MHSLHRLADQRQRGAVHVGAGRSGDAARHDAARPRHPGTVRTAPLGERHADHRGDPERARRRLWLHSGALAAVLVAVLVLMGPSSIVVPDEGLYLAQADSLAKGSWSVPRQGVDVDDDGDYSRLLPESVMGDREIPYARHAAYPLVIAPAFWLGDYVGTIVVSLLGLWGAAVSGAFIAWRLGRRLAVPTLWLIGLGSPLLFYGYVTMGHALAAAAAGTAFVGITRWLDDRAWTGLVAGVAALSFTVLLRSEGTLYAFGVVAAIGLLSLPARGTRRFERRAFLTAVLLGCAVVVTYVLDTRITDAVTGGDGYGLNPGAIAMRDSADPLSGSWASLLRPFAGSWDSGALWVTIAAVSLVGASVLLRVAKRSTSALVPLSVGAVAAVAMLVDPPSLVTGLFAAFPLLVAGLIQLRRSDLSPSVSSESFTSSTSSELLSRIVLTTLITSAGLVATLYGNGGAAEWGGRFFHLLIPVIAPVAALGLERGALVLPDPQGRVLSQRRIAIVCALGITAALSISGLRAQAGIRAKATDTVDGAIAYASEESDDALALVVVANTSPGGNSRAFWRPADSIDVLTTIALEQLGPALERAAAAGRDRVVVVSDASLGELHREVGDELEASGWSVLDSAATPSGHSNLFTVGAR